ncbi:MAG TPA: SDR family NAD(P)-dependent oxidoreductase [Candidatus Dormibacteraeota bacterium]|nr:SDR family NAD(P)-dependent oxidoreductase [Candidatus Dormibacteraeota bacterium]
MNFHDKIVLVTGGTGGLGREVTMAFLEAGASVVVTYQREEEFAAVASAAERAGATPPDGAAVDVTDAAAVEKFVAGIVAKHGRLDVLVNTVGGYAGGKNLWETDSATYDRMLQLNMKAGFVLAQAVVPVMIRQNCGWIVNLASKAALDHGAGGALYAASKAGALALFDSLAAEVKPYNINVNSVLPSIIDTSANRKAMPKADFSKWPKPEEIARVILFLCSEEARVIHGAAIPVYGKT